MQPDAVSLRNEGQNRTGDAARRRASTNGPGDPEAAEEAVVVVEKLITNSNYGPDQMPVFGICMGTSADRAVPGRQHYKLKCGHRGCNHGVFDKNSGRSYITSQNHGFAVKAESIVLKGLEMTHLNLERRNGRGHAASE